MMKILSAVVTIFTGCLGISASWAGDYSVAIVNPGTQFEGGGTSLKLYETSSGGVKLIQTYVLEQYDQTGHLASPLTLAISPAHDFVYVAYTGLNQPDLVGFQIKSTGLVKQWEQEISTGSAGLAGATLIAGSNYVIANTYPIGLYLYAFSQTGSPIVSDAYDDEDLISGHIDASETYYYSCRSANFSPPATSVAVYKLASGVHVLTYSAAPVTTSKDAVYVQSICD